MGLWEQFPYPVYHNLNLDWVLKKLREFGAVIDGLDAYIDEKIKEGLDALGLEQIIVDIMTKYSYAINVKLPPNGLVPAKGDGTTNDGATIQGCIDYAAAQGGGVVFFPFGKYLTDSLTIKDNVALMGLDRYSTGLVLSGGADVALINGVADNVNIGGLRLDGNSGVQVNDVEVVKVSGSGHLLENLIVEDGYRLLELVENGNCQIDNIMFGNAVNQCANITGTGYVQAKGLVFNHLSSVGGDVVMDIGTSYGDYEFSSTATCPTCLMIGGIGNRVNARIRNALKAVDDVGVKNIINVLDDSGVTDNVNDSLSVNVKETLNVGGKNINIISSVLDVNQGMFTQDLTKRESKFNGDDLILNPTNPVTYRNPEKINEQFSYVPAKTPSGSDYKILVAGEHFVPTGGILNIKDYGAIGDGITDDSDAIIACANDNNIIIIPEGFYVVTKTINLPNKFITGNGNIVRKGDEENFTLLSFSGNCGIDGITITGVGDLQGRKSGIYEISFDNCDNFYCKNVKINNITCDSGIFVVNSSNGAIYNNVISNYSYSGILLRHSVYNTIVSNNSVLNAQNYTYVNSYGIILGDSSQTLSTVNSEILCVNNVIKNSFAFWEGIDAHSLTNSVISNNIITNCYSGIAIVRPNQSGYAISKNLTITNNTVFYDTNITNPHDRGMYCGITLQNRDDITSGVFNISSNNIINNGTKESNDDDSAIRILGAYNCNIFDNLINDCKGFGIFLGVGTNYNVNVKSNIIFNQTNSSKNTINGAIACIHNNNNNYIFIDDNKLENCDTTIMLPTESVTNNKHLYCRKNYSGGANAIINSIGGGWIPDIYDQTPNTGNKGDIIINLNVTTGSNYGWICTQSGSLNSAAVWSALPTLN